MWTEGEKALKIKHKGRNIYETKRGITCGTVDEKVRA